MHAMLRRYNDSCAAALHTRRLADRIVAGENVTADVALGAHAPTLVEPVGTNLVALEGGMLDVFKLTATPFSVSYSGQAIAIPRTPDVSEVSAAYTGSRFLVAASGMVPTFLLDDRGTLAPVAGVDAGGQVASNGTDFLLTQQQGNQVIARQVAADGTVGASHAWAYDPGSYYTRFRLTSPTARPCAPPASPSVCC